MFGIKEVTNEVMIERIKKSIKYRNYYALFFFIFSMVHFYFFFYFWFELEPSFLNSYQKLAKSMFAVGRTIQESDTETLGLVVNVSHIMGIKIGISLLSLGFCGTIFLIHGFYVLFGRRKDCLLIKLYESVSQDKTGIDKAMV